MKLLFLSNFLPPYGLGGYEEWCLEVALGLRERGHSVTVLTSCHGVPARQVQLPPLEPKWVARDLHLEMPLVPLRNSWVFFTERRRNEKADVERLGKLIESVQPDSALIWGMWNIPRSVPATVETLLGHKVAYFVSDYWPSLGSQYWDYWNAPAKSGLGVLPKAGLRKIARYQLARESSMPLDLRYVMVPSVFVGEELLRRGLQPDRIEVVPVGINLRAYHAAPESQVVDDTQPFTLLYVGRLSEDKGVHTAIEALAIVARDSDIESIRLLIAGSGSDEYEAQLHALAIGLGVHSHILWLGRRPKEVMPSIYRLADALLFTSIWPEPFSRVILEAMASGTAVIGAPVGGEAEILRDNENALTFAPGDAVDLARQITRLVNDDALRTRLAVRGQELAQANWDLGQMITSIEDRLLAL